MTLPPVPWARHLWLPAATGAAGALGWWLSLQAVLWVGLPAGLEGPAWLALVSCLVVGTALWADAVAVGRGVRRVFVLVALCVPACALSVSVCAGAGTALAALAARGGALDQVGLVSLRGQILAFLLAGLGAGVWLAVGRLLPRLLARWWPDRSLTDPTASWVVAMEHGAAGLVAGAAWGGIWFVAGLYEGLGGDLFAAAAVGSATFGVLLGALAGNAPDEAWTPWLRVRRGPRMGMRVPLIDEDGRVVERFVGHYPRGMDLFLPFASGASEVHVSVTVDQRGDVVVRGHSIAPTTLARFLEAVDLAYDPASPAPVEAVLSPGDVVRLGSVELELLYLPRTRS